MGGKFSGGGGGGVEEMVEDEVTPRQRCDTQAIIPAYRLPVIGAGLRGHSVQRLSATAVLT